MIVSRVHESLEGLARLITREKDARLQTRLRAVRLALQGRDAPFIASVLGVGRRTVQEWVARFNEDGIAGLRERPRTGQPKRLTDEQEEQVCRWLDESLSRGPADDRPVLRGPQIRAMIERHFGQKMSLSGAYALLHRLGYEPLRPRPRHDKADPVKQAQFKAAAPLFSAP